MRMLKNFGAAKKGKCPLQDQLVTNLDMHQSYLGELCKNRDSQAMPLEVDSLCSPHPQTEALHLQSEMRLNLHISPEKQQSDISNPY